MLKYIVKPSSKDFTKWTYNRKSMQPVQLDFLLYLCLGCFQKPSSNEQILLDISLSQTNNILLTFHQPTYPERTVACTLSPRNIMSKNSALFRSLGKEDTKQKNTIFLNSALLHTLKSTSMIWVGFLFGSLHPEFPHVQ